MNEEGEFIRHEACPHCGSSDANALYSSGKHYCFSCQTLTPAENQVEAVAILETVDSIFLDLEYKELKKRGITQKTCEFWGYGTAQYRGQAVQAANYRTRSGDLVAQKIRFANKDFSVIGNMKEVNLFGEHLWRDGGQRIVITEGELDALSMSQVQDNKFPVVSLPSGCTSAKKAVGKSLEWLSNFDSIILMFDMDEAGQKAAKEVASILPPNKAKIASLPLKDANEMLVAGRVAELIDAFWGAKTYRPDGIVAGTDLWDVVTTDDEKEAMTYPFTGMQEKTGGIRKGEVVTITAGSGIGKSQLAREVAHHIVKHGQTLGYIALEESVKRTALGMMSI